MALPDPQVRHQSGTLWRSAELADLRTADGPAGHHLAACIVGVIRVILSSGRAVSLMVVMALAR
jgi:hypothetical protein